mgnify:CR=1 FL=1
MTSLYPNLTEYYDIAFRSSDTVLAFSSLVLVVIITLRAYPKLPRAIVPYLALLMYLVAAFGGVR